MSYPHVRIALHVPPHPFWPIGTVLLEHLAGNKGSLPDGSTVSILTPRFGMGDFENLLMVANGEADLGLTTPTTAATMAMKGVGPYGRPFRNVRAVGVLPHFDYFVWAVNAKTGVTSFQEISEKKMPLRIAIGRRSPNGLDLRAFTALEVLKRYGITEEELTSWGGKIIYAGDPKGAIAKVISGEADGVFHEGQFLREWLELVKSLPVNFLSLDREVADHMLQSYGFASRVVPKGRYEGLINETLTIDYSGFLVFTTEEFDDDIVRRVTEALVKSLVGIGEIFSKPPPESRTLTCPIQPQTLGRDTAIPLHPAALEYYKQNGYL